MDSRHDDFSWAPVEAVLARALRLVGKTLRDLYGDVRELPRGKGSLGQLVERLHFGYEPNSSPEVDFPKANLELKVTGAILRGKAWRAKERLVLSNISYTSLATEKSFAASSFLTKNGELLLIVYHWTAGTLPMDFRFLGSGVIRLLELEAADRLIIEQDWKKIQQSVLDGLAHELSEGDTTYLAAARKGAGRGLDNRLQPFSDIPAPNRAFSFKQSFLTRLMAPIVRGAKAKRTDEESLVKNAAELATKTFDELVLERFNPYIGRTVDDIAAEVSPELNWKAKGALAVLARRMLGITTRRIVEFEKADITMKIVRIEDNGKPKESMSFPAFKYLDLVEQTWLGSDLREMWSSRFLFVFFVADGESYRFHHAALWAMPPKILDVEVRRIWEETVKRIRNGRAHDLPGMTDSPVAHVRPHARDSRDTVPTPDGRNLTKKCFWLKAEYIGEIFRSTTIAQSS